MDHVEHGPVHGMVELDARHPFLDPANPPLDRFDARQRDPDGVVGKHADRKLDPAAFRRKIEQVDTPAVFACPVKVDVCAKRKPLRPASMAFHSRPLVVPSFDQPSFNRPSCEGDSSGKAVIGFPIGRGPLAR